MADLNLARENLRELTARQRVLNGARWLDENFPGWEGRIDLDTLELSSSSQCICGQVFRELADKAPTGVDGFTIAHRTLFSEANSWITGMILMESIPVGWQEGDPMPDLSWEQTERASVVGALLGFMSDRDSGIPDDHDHDPVGYWDLQQEWHALVKERTE